MLLLVLSQIEYLNTPPNLLNCSHVDEKLGEHSLVENTDTFERKNEDLIRVGEDTHRLIIVHYEILTVVLVVQV